MMPTRELSNKKISPSGTGAILATPPSPPRRRGVERGCVTFEFPGRFCRLFIISLASEERIPKQLKQVSIVCMHKITKRTIEFIILGRFNSKSRLIFGTRIQGPNESGFGFETLVSTVLYYKTLAALIICKNNRLFRLNVYNEMILMY